MQRSLQNSRGRLAASAMTGANRLPLFVRLASPLMTTLLAQGITVRPLALLTVHGRSSGRLHATPVAVLERGGQRWVAAIFGEVGWTHNLRAAGQAILTRGGTRMPVGALELTPEAAGQVLKDAVAPNAASGLAAWVLRRYLHLRPDVALSEFVAAARRHPVFELRESSRASETATPPYARRQTMSLKFTRIDRQRFGPWAIVTGASSGIGKEFARQLAASGLNLVLVARRQDALEKLGGQLSADFGIEYRAVGLDLSDEGFLDRLEASTHDLEVGLVVSNAGGALSFFTDMLDQEREGLHRMLRLNTGAHLDLAHHFGRRLAERGRGGLLLVSSLGARQGWPGAADYAASKAFVMVLGESLHVELGKLGVSVTVLLPGATETEMVRSYGVDAATMNQMMRPMRLMSVYQVVAEGLGALNANRPAHITGRMNRTMASLLPRGAFTRILGSMSAQLRAKQPGAQLA